MQGMTCALRLCALLAAAAGASAAVTYSSVSASSSSGGGLGSRGGFRRPSGGTAFVSSSSVNGRPPTVTSFTSGTGQTSFAGGSGFGTFGNRGGFRVPTVPPIRFPQIRVPQIGYPSYQYGYYGNNRFNSGLNNRFGGQDFASNQLGSGIDANGFFNRIANQINSAFNNNVNSGYGR